MKLSKFLLSALVSLSSYAYALEADPEDVTDLSGKPTEEFNKFIEDHPVVLAKFFTTWCGHCKRLQPEFQVAATQLKEKNVSLVEIDCDKSQALCAEHKVQGYPSLYVFKSLDNKSQYQGGRTADDIIKYMNKELLPPYVKVTPESIDKFKGTNPVNAIAFFDDKESNTTFVNVAEQLHHEYNLGYSADLKFAKTLGVSSFPAVVIYVEDSEPVVYDAETFGDAFAFTEEAIPVNLVRASIAPGGEIGPETFRSYMTAELPMAYFFYETPEQREEFYEALLPVAKEVKSKLNLGFIDASKYGSHAANINLEEKFPAFAIHDLKSNFKFPLSQEKDLTAADVIAWTKDWAAGKIAAKIKSDPIPETQEGPVYTVVGDNYNDIVLDDDKDVLIEFYAPWCGHCKKLAPTYDELGALFFDTEYKDKVVVAKFDHQSNEAEGIHIQGYPTIMLFPAGKKDSPIVFESSRSLEALNDFIRDNGSHGIDGLAGKKAAASKSKKTKKAKKAKKAKKTKAADGKDEL